MTLVYTCKHCREPNSYEFSVDSSGMVTEIDGPEECAVCQSSIDMTDIQAKCQDQHWDDVQENIEKRYERDNE